MRDLAQHVHLQVGREWVGQAHVARERAQDQVAHLDAVRRHDVAERVVVVAQELGEVVQQHEQHAQRPLAAEAGNGQQNHRNIFLITSKKILFAKIYF